MVNKDFMESQIIEAWRDVRSYISSIWQVSALCLAIVGVTINVVVGGTYGLVPVYETWLGWTILVFASMFVGITLRIMTWYQSVLITRADFIDLAETQIGTKKLNFFSDHVPVEKRVSSDRTWGFGFLLLCEGHVLPRILFIFFYIIAGGLSFSMLFQWPFLVNDIISVSVVIIVPALFLLNVGKLIYENIRIAKDYKAEVEMRENESVHNS